MLKEYTTEKIRNIAVVSHGGAGKTSLVEALLYNCKHTNRLGSVEAGSSVADSLPEEIKRKTTIRTKIIPCEWKDIKINMIDTPGFADFSGDILAGLKAADVAVVVICAVSGIQVGTEKVFKHIKLFELPRVFFVNKIDRENIEMDNLIQRLVKKYGTGVTPVIIPIGIGQECNGVIDVIKMKAYFYSGNDGSFTEKDIPDEFKSNAQDYHNRLVESVVETDEALMEKYLSEEKLAPEEIAGALKNGIKKGDIFPLACGSATKNIGINQFLDLIKEYLPDPSFRGEIGVNQDGKEVKIKTDDSSPLIAYVFKIFSEPNMGDLSYFRIFTGRVSSGNDVYNTTKNSSERFGQILCMRGRNRDDLPVLHTGDIGAVAKLKNTSAGDTLASNKNGPLVGAVKLPHSVISIALKPESKKDQEKLGEGLSRICSEDPTLKYYQDVEFNQTVLAGLGEIHLEVAVEKLRERYNVSVTTEKTRVPYRETITAKAEAQGKYKRQTGGRGQYGDCWLRLEHYKENEYEFVDEIVGGVIPGKYIPSVEKGVKGAMAQGILAGYPVINVKVACYDGSYHSVDSSDIAFQIAGSLGFKAAMEKARPVLLEPIMNVEVTVPDEYFGDITGNISSRRGKVQGIEAAEGLQTIKALIPMAEMDRYSTDLKAMTQGKGDYTMSFSHYEVITGKLSEIVIEEARRYKEKREKEKAEA